VGQENADDASWTSGHMLMLLRQAVNNDKSDEVTAT